MIKITKISTIVVIAYIFVFTQIWGDNHIILYGSSLIVVVSMALCWLKDRNIELSTIPYGIWNNFIMIVYSLITGLFVAYNYNSLISSCITFASFSVICVAICYISVVEKDFEWLFNTLIVVALVCAIWLLFNGQAWKGYGRTLSYRNNPHFLAAVMNLGIFSVAYKCRKFDTKGFLTSGVLIILFIYCIIECGSRKYLIVSMFFIVIWGWNYSSSIWKTNNPNQRILLTVFLGLVILFILYYFINVYSTTLLHSRMLDAEDDGNVKRVYLYQSSIRIFLDSPIVGKGYDQFKYWSYTGGYAHSTYAEALADFGVIGCLLYFLPILSTTYKITRCAFMERKDYRSRLMLALCASELFIGVGQIFFMEFYLFIAWTILFNYSFISETMEKNKELKEIQGETPSSKYIR